MATSRAAALLESLSGRESDLEGPHRRRLFSRGTLQREIRKPRSHDSDAMDVDTSGEAHPTPPRFSNLLTLVAAVVLVLAAVSGWRLLSRPASLEERMPQVQADDVSAVDARLGGSAGGQTGAPPPDVSPNAGSPASAGDTGSATADPRRRITVHVAGAVTSPGVVELSADSRVVDAVTAAGGLRPDADPDRLNLASVLSDGVRIVVPTRGAEPLAEVPIEMPSPIGSPADPTGGADGGAGPLVNINRATAPELQKLPGIGPATSAAIIAKREKDGPFESVESLMDVRGIGEAKLGAIRDMVTVG